MEKPYFKQLILTTMAVCLFLIKIHASEPTDTIGIIDKVRNLSVSKSEGLIKIYADYIGMDGKQSFFYYSFSDPETANNKTEKKYQKGNKFNSQSLSDTLLLYSEADKVEIIKVYPESLFLNVWSENKEKSYSFTIGKPQKENEFEEKQCEHTTELGKHHELIKIPLPNSCNYWAIGTEGICIGFLKTTGTETAHEFKWNKSLELGWLSVLNCSFHFMHRSSLMFGIGVNWRDYRLENHGKYLIKKENALRFEEFEENQTDRFSSLKNFSLQFPFLYKYILPGNYISMSVGGIMNITTHSSLTHGFRIGKEEKHQISYSYNGIRKITFDLFFNVSYSGLIGCYIRYSPLTQIRSAESINFYPLSIGLSLGI